MSDEEQVNKPVDTSALLKWLTEAGYDLDYDSAYNLGSHLHLAGAANEDSDKGSVITTGEIMDVLNLVSTGGSFNQDDVTWERHPREWSSTSYTSKVPKYKGEWLWDTPEYRKWFAEAYPQAMPHWVSDWNSRKSGATSPWAGISSALAGSPDSRFKGYPSGARPTHDYFEHLAGQESPEQIADREGATSYLERFSFEPHPRRDVHKNATGEYPLVDGQWFWTTPEYKKWYSEIGNPKHAAAQGTGGFTFGSDFVGSSQWLPLKFHTSTKSEQGSMHDYAKENLGANSLLEAFLKHMRGLSGSAPSFSKEQISTGIKNMALGKDAQYNIWKNQKVAPFEFWGNVDSWVRDYNKILSKTEADPSEYVAPALTDEQSVALMYEVLKAQAGEDGTRGTDDDVTGTSGRAAAYGDIDIDALTLSSSLKADLPGFDSDGEWKRVIAGWTADQSGNKTGDGSWYKPDHDMGGWEADNYWGWIRPAKATPEDKLEMTEDGYWFYDQDDGWLYQGVDDSGKKVGWVFNEKIGDTGAWIYPMTGDGNGNLTNILGDELDTKPDVNMKGRTVWYASRGTPTTGTDSVSTGWIEPNFEDGQIFDHSTGEWLKPNTFLELQKVDDADPGTLKAKERYAWTGESDFIANKYRDALGREGDAESLAHWNERLNDGEWSDQDEADFAAMLEAAKEQPPAKEPPTNEPPAGEQPPVEAFFAKYGNLEGDAAYTAAYNDLKNAVKQYSASGLPGGLIPAIIDKTLPKVGQFFKDLFGADKGEKYAAQYDAFMQQAADSEALKSNLADTVTFARQSGLGMLPPWMDLEEQAKIYWAEPYLKGEDGEYLTDENGAYQANPDYKEGYSFFYKHTDPEGNVEVRTYDPSSPFDMTLADEWQTMKDVATKQFGGILDEYYTPDADGVTGMDRNIAQKKTFLEDAGLLGEDNLMERAVKGAADTIYGDEFTEGSQAKRNKDYLEAAKYYNDVRDKYDVAGYKDLSDRRATLVDTVADVSGINNARTRGGERLRQARFFGGPIGKGGMFENNLTPKKTMNPENYGVRTHGDGSKITGYSNALGKSLYDDADTVNKLTQSVQSPKTDSWTIKPARATDGVYDKDGKYLGAQKTVAEKDPKNKFFTSITT